jgi:ubiquinone/menaquinone biosynthesis C-methylase UbiE
VKHPRDYYDTFSVTYEHGRDQGYHALIDDLEVEIAAEFATGGRVLEAGCGTGRLLNRLAPVAVQAVGADLSRGMLGTARGRGLAVVQADLGALPFPDGAFDLVYSFKVLAHVPHIEDALRELARVVRPGGRLLLEFYNPWSLRYLGKRLKRPTHVGQETTDFDVYTRYDAPTRIGSLLPPGVRLVALRGVRVVTPFAQIFRVPVLARAIAAAERRCVRSPLRYFAGFLIAVAERSRES